MATWGVRGSSTPLVSGVATPPRRLGIRGGDGAVRFEWDANKAASNLRKHRVSFDEAVTVFYDPLAATFEDPDHSKAERRLITVG